MRDKVRSPPRGRGYSPPRGSRYSPPHGRRYSLTRGGGYSRLHNRTLDNRRGSLGRVSGQGHDYLQFGGSREMNSLPSSRFGEMERSRRGMGGAGDVKEKRNDYKSKHLDGGRDRERPYTEHPRFNDDLSRRDTASMKFQWNHLMEQPGRVNIDGTFSNEPNNRDGQSWKMPRSDEVLPQRDPSSVMFQKKHVPCEIDRITSIPSHSPKHFAEYDGSSSRVSTKRNYQDSRLEELGGSRMLTEKPLYANTELAYPTYSPRSGHKRNYPDIGANDTFSPLKKLNAGNYKDDVLGLHDRSPANKLSADLLSARDFYKEEEIHRHYSRDEKRQSYSREEQSQFYQRDEEPQSYMMKEKTHVYSREEKPYSYSREDNSRLYSKDTTHYGLPSPHSDALPAVPSGSSMGDFRHSYKETVAVSSDGYTRSSGHPTLPLPLGDTRLSNSKSHRYSNLDMENDVNYKKDQMRTPRMGIEVDYHCLKAQRSDYSELISQDYGRMRGAKDNFRNLDSLRTRSMDPIKDRVASMYSSGKEHMTEDKLLDDRCSLRESDRLWDNRCFSQERSVPNYFDGPRSSYTGGDSLEDLGRGQLDLQYGREAYRSQEKVSLREGYGYGRDLGVLNHEERRRSYLGDQYADRRDGRTNRHLLTDYDDVYVGAIRNFNGEFRDSVEGFEVDEMGVLQKPKDFNKRRDISKRLSRNDGGAHFSINKNISSKVHNLKTKKPLMSRLGWHNPKTFSEIVRPRKFSSFASGSASVGKSQHLNSRLRDIKKRLGPARPGSRHSGIAQPFVKSHKLRKILRKNQDDDHGSVNAEEGVPLEPDIETLKSEPPENSEEFKQLVRIAFFKFIKQLNENTAELKKLKGQGKTGSLKCCVCGSDSEDFPDTESLVKHASAATKVGVRVQHLGFHKALCALMGWKAAEVHKSEWVREVQTSAETAYLKDDFIIWPPLVVIHNSSIGSSNPNGRGVVSVEGLESVIREKGFGDKVKVCRGKPANQSNMVVKFSATFSGFREAEKLHKFFSDIKHGRTEFLKMKSKSFGDSNHTKKASIKSVSPDDSNETKKVSIKSDSVDDSNETKKVSIKSDSPGDSNETKKVSIKSDSLGNSDESKKAAADSIEDVLYGYLGLAKDLNKLDFETKRRCLIRSKKEVQELGDTLLFS